MKYTMPAVIFAGGKSSRMGRDKALLPFAGYSSLSEFQYNKLCPLFDNVYISAKEDKFDFDAMVTTDLYEENSPLIGIISLFETLDADELFILSVDAPFVDKKVIEVLLTHTDEKFDAIIAKSPSGIQPLCGIYRRSILPLAQENRKENHRLHDLLKKAHTQFVTFDADAPFTNLNHLHEYEEAIKSLILP